MLETTEATWEIDVIASPARLTIAYFTAPWCAPCRMLKPVLEQLESESEGLTIARIDASIDSLLADQFGIKTVPTLLLYNAGSQVGRIEGIKPKNVLQEAFAKYL